MQWNQNSYTKRPHLSSKYKQNYAEKYEYHHHNEHAMYPFTSGTITDIMTSRTHSQHLL